MGNPKSLSLYVIENNGVRMLIDSSTPENTERIINRLKHFNLYPIHKILLTHSHWDHIAGTNRLRDLIDDINVEILASEKAIDKLKNPGLMNDVFDISVDPIEDVIPLKEGDLINLNGFMLEVVNFFGHTFDSIGIFDRQNRNIFTGDAIINRSGSYYKQPVFMPPEFNESALLNTFQRLKTMRDELDSVSLAHFGVWKKIHFKKILNNMEEFHFNAKNSLIEWYNKDLTIKEIATNYFETYIPKLRMIKDELLDDLMRNIDWLLKGLKRSNIIEN